MNTAIEPWFGSPSGPACFAGARSAEHPSRRHHRRWLGRRGRGVLIGLFVLGLGLLSRDASAAVPSATVSTNLVPLFTKATPENGELLFNVYCLPCHQPAGQGRVGLAPSIRNRDFLALASDDFIRDTIHQGRAGTAMVPRPDLDDVQVNALIAYLRAEPVALPVHAEVDWSARFAGDAAAGRPKYEAFCMKCHGPHGEGYFAGGPGTAIGLPGFLDVAADDYILQTLKYGRVGTPMRSFIGPMGLANLSESDAHDIIAYLRELGARYQEIANRPAGPGNAQVGQIHFTINCSPCHQMGGVGKIGFAPSIRNPDFLALASDDFIKHTVKNGRIGTGMVARPDLPEQTVNDIIAYLRDLPQAKGRHYNVDPSRTYAGDAVQGEAAFATYCAACHGPNGEGYVLGVPGPGIGLPGFLDVASDDYIYQTVKHGRVGTPMKSLVGPLGLANLENEDVYNIISFLRILKDRAPAAPVEDTSNPYE